MQILSLEDRQLYQDPEKARRPLWLDCTPEEIEQLAPVFQLHRVTVQYCLTGDQRPKVEEYAGYLFMVANLYHQDAVHVLNIIMGRDFLISVHNPGISLQPPPVSERGYPPRPPELLHWLLDRAVDTFFTPLEEISSRLEQLQEEILLNPGRASPAALFDLRRQLVRLRHSIATQEQMLRVAVTLESLTGEQELGHYFTDVHGHALQLADMADNQREMVALSIETYLSATANRTNEVMRVLAVITTIFMPLTLITGIYGMNFARMPELGMPYGYFTVLAVMGALGFSLFLFFRHRRWI